MKVIFAGIFCLVFTKFCTSGYLCDSDIKNVLKTPQVSVLVGDPIELDDLVKENAEEGLSRAALYDAIAARVGQHMRVMKEELDQLVAARELQLAVEESQKLHTVERAQGLLQYLDWEAQGLVPENDFIAKEKHTTLLSSIHSQQNQTDKGHHLQGESF